MGILVPKDLGIAFVILKNSMLHICASHQKRALQFYLFMAPYGLFCPRPIEMQLFILEQN